MNSQVKQLILDAAVERISNLMFEEFMGAVHDSVSEAMEEICGDTIDYDKMETFDTMLELCGRIAIVGLPE
jgi:hypothetical protein